MIWIRRMPDREMKGTASARFDGQQVGDGPRWASIAEVSVLAQRAIWLRLLPMRAICRVRPRSTAAAGAIL